jgi:hypothetical protein
METLVYLVKKCKSDGSTPLGQCPEVEITAPQLPRHNTYQSLLAEFFKLYPDWDVVSWGLKDEISAYRKRLNN